jgi:hypothetical protein
MAQIAPADRARLEGKGALLLVREGKVRIFDCTNERVGDSDLALLKNEDSIVALGLSDSDVTDDGVLALRATTKLGAFRAGRTAITDVGVSHILKSNPEITCLWIDGTKVTDAVMDSVMALKDLRDFSVSRTRLSARALGRLAESKSLVHLSMSGTAVDDDVLIKLATLPKLEVVVARQASISDACMAALSRSSSLKNLELAGTNISDAGIRQLSSSGTIEQLGLAGTKVSDDSLNSLATLKSLRILQVTGTQMSRDAIAAFRSRMPQVKVYPMDAGK